jgi:hypothetical protein
MVDEAPAGFHALHLIVFYANITHIRCSGRQTEGRSGQVLFPNVSFAVIDTGAFVSGQRRH